MKRIVVHAGDKYGRLTIVKEIESLSCPTSKKRRFHCKCECGSKVNVLLGHLRAKKIVSCGCKNLESITKHGLYKHPLYSVWSNMLGRCNDPKYENYPLYGGRGIKVSKIWSNEKGLQNFIEWNESLPMEKRFRKGLQIDRINNDKGYSPSNCRWATSLENNNNKRSNVYILYKNNKYTFKEFWRKYNKGIKYTTAHSRWVKGMTPIKAVSKQLET